MADDKVNIKIYAKDYTELEYKKALDGVGISVLINGIEQNYNDEIYRPVINGFLQHIEKKIKKDYSQKKYYLEVEDNYRIEIITTEDKEALDFRNVNYNMKTHFIDYYDDEKKIDDIDII